MTLRLPAPCLVVLVGPSCSGKSVWAEANFRPDQIVSSDKLRALVGEGEHDQRAGKDAFDVLDLVIRRRLRRGLVTVVDTLGLDGKKRRGFADLAREYGVPCYAVAFDTPADVCKSRNRQRARRVPANVIDGQLRSWAAVQDMLADEPFDGVAPPDDVVLVPPALHRAPAFAAQQKEQPVTLAFGLQIPRFTWQGGPAELGPRLADIAGAAEEAGFSSIWVMDHFLQIPVAGREWEDMLDSYTTLGFLAGNTTTARLGALVTGVTYRNIAHLAKIVATLDVLSGGRAMCGIGAAWFAREHAVYGFDFPPLRERYDRLEDALQLLPLMWGKGAPAFSGKTISVPEAICYPRPLQDRVPIMVGGGGEKKTLRLVAQYADACNLFGDAATVRHKVGVLAQHCADISRDPAEITVTHLSTTLTGRDADELADLSEQLRPDSMSPEAWAARVNAGTVDDQIGRFRELADAGVQTAIVSFPDLGGTDPVERFAEVIAAFS